MTILWRRCERPIILQICSEKNLTALKSVYLNKRYTKERRMTMGKKTLYAAVLLTCLLLCAGAKGQGLSLDLPTSRRKSPWKRPDRGS